MVRIKTTVVDERLAPMFSKLSKPAQRALVNARIFSAQELAARTLSEIISLHGIGESSIPILEAILAEQNLTFMPSERKNARGASKRNDEP